MKKMLCYVQSALISVNKVIIIIGIFVCKLTILEQSTRVPFERQFKCIDRSLKCLRFYQFKVQFSNHVYCESQENQVSVIMQTTKVEISANIGSA